MKSHRAQFLSDAESIRSVLPDPGRPASILTIEDRDFNDILMSSTLYRQAALAHRLREDASKAKTADTDRNLRMTPSGDKPDSSLLKWLGPLGRRASKPPGPEGTLPESREELAVLRSEEVIRAEEVFEVKTTFDDIMMLRHEISLLADSSYGSSIRLEKAAQLVELMKGIRGTVTSWQTRSVRLEEGGKDVDCRELIEYIHLLLSEHVDHSYRDLLPAVSVQIVAQLDSQGI